LLTVQHGWARNEVYLRDLPGPGPLRTIVKDVDAHFRPAFAGDRLVMQTDWMAPRGRIVEVDVLAPAPEKWHDVVPEGKDAIQGYALAGGQLVVHSLHDVASSLRLFTLDGEPRGDLPLPGLGSVASLEGRWADPELFFDFTSYTTPRAIYHADVRRGRVDPWWK